MPSSLGYNLSTTTATSDISLPSQRRASDDRLSYHLTVLYSILIPADWTRINRTLTRIRRRFHRTAGKYLPIAKFDLRSRRPLSVHLRRWSPSDRSTNIRSSRAPMPYPAFSALSGRISAVRAPPTPLIGRSQLVKGKLYLILLGRKLFLCF
jgi:hypothetical protein